MNGAFVSDTSSLNHQHARWPNSRFCDVDLTASVFDDVSLRRADFHNVALTGATFRDVYKADVSISQARLDGMTIDGVPVTELQRAYAQLQGQSKGAAT